MKSVLISIQPKWCELIASGKKTVEVRKTRPRIAMPFKCYIYCTKDEPLYHSGEKFWCKKAGEFGNGKVIGEFVCSKITNIRACFSLYGRRVLECEKLIRESACLTFDEIFDYLINGSGEHGYCLHISDLVIYDVPKSLRDFYLAAYRQGNRVRPQKPLTRAPQSWCYVEEVTP